MSNEAKMTLEEKITQRLKSDTLMTLVGDEDAITELVRRAVKEALYQPQRIPRGYGGFDERDSLAVAAARDVAKAAAEKATDALVKELLEAPEVRKIMLDALQAAIPAAIMSAISGTLVNGIVSHANVVAMDRAREAVDFMRTMPR